MREAVDAIEDTSDYTREEIARKKAIHNKDVADLIRDEHNTYYEKVRDYSLAYDDLALGGERDLEKVRERFYVASAPSNRRHNSSRLPHFEEQVFPDCKHCNSPIYVL